MCIIYARLIIYRNISKSSREYDQCDSIEIKFHNLIVQVFLSQTIINHPVIIYKAADRV